MYNIEPTLLDRLKNPIQTKANNNDPNPLVYITRNRTAITSQWFWERQLITTEVGTRSSIAVRRPEGHLLGDMIFTAQIEDGDAIIRRAEPTVDINKMKWAIYETIPNVSDISLAFDGFMTKKDDVVEMYTLGNLPYVFYIDSGGLQFWDLYTDNQGTISNNAVAVDAVRGLYSETAGINDGIWVFFINSSGELWEVRFLNGEVEELKKITKKPNVNVTSWEDVWAGMTWDYRIILQLKGNDGIVYALPSSSRPYGFSSLEYVGISRVTLTGKLGEIPPEPLIAENIFIQGRWDKVIKISFDRKVYNVSSCLKDYFRILDLYGTPTYPMDVSYGATDLEVYLWFDSFYRKVQPFSVEYLGGTDFGGTDFQMEQFIVSVSVANIVPNDCKEYVGISSIILTGSLEELEELEESKGYVSEALMISNFVLTGQFEEVEFVNRRSDEHVEISGITLTGQFRHIDEGGT